MAPEVLAALVARFLLIEAPALLDMINTMRSEGRTEVTDVDMAMLAGKWNIPAESFFVKDEEVP